VAPDFLSQDKTSEEKMKSGIIVGLVAVALVAIVPAPSQGEVGVRIKDIATIQGARNNQLVGYGLVVGLDDTGDNVRFSRQSMASFLSRMGLSVNSTDVRTNNVAAVVVTAELPPFAREGTRIDVTVSCVGDAESLQGGTLLLTPLRGADSEVYATAQGSVSIGGFNFRTGVGDRTQRNHPTVGRIPSGGIIEREVRSPFIHEKHLYLLLRTPDFTTAHNLMTAINDYYGDHTVAQALDPGTVDVNLAAFFAFEPDPVAIIAEIENLRVFSDTPARVVINERTGTVVAGQTVRISTVAISHAGVSVEITSTPVISQPAPFSEGETVVTQDQELLVTEEESGLKVVEEGATIADLVKGLNDFGVTKPRDVIAIFQALKEAGALNAELVIM
jgi:flagellar P-ring protein precursor FlgI